eukprot:4100406-Amphidinium_carterae.1
MNNAVTQRPREPFKLKSPAVVSKWSVVWPTSLRAAMESYPLAFGNVATVQGWLGFGQCGVQEEVIAHIMDMEPDKVMLVTDEQVNSLHGDYFDSIEAKSCDGETGSESAPAVKLEKFVLPNGDACKSWDNLKAL